MDRGKPRTVHGQSAWAWLIPPFLLLGSAAGVAFVLLEPTWAVRFGLGTLFGLVFLWVFVSVLWPSRADRVCGACGANALERLDPDTAHGLVCRACGWSDDSLGAWLLAEEDEERLERLVLSRREVERPAGAP